MSLEVCKALNVTCFQSAIFLFIAYRGATRDKSANLRLRPRCKLSSVDNPGTIDSSSSFGDTLDRRMTEGLRILADTDVNTSTSLIVA